MRALKKWRNDMLIKPDFFDEFKCKASECKHTCCRGWEIDIDPISLSRYLNYEGKLGKKMKESITFQDEEFCFKTDEEGRCPFLREDGLCEIIIEKGEDELSDICALHPRFFFDYKDISYSGFGMACEVISDKITSELVKDNISFILEDTEVDGNLTEKNITLEEIHEYNKLRNEACGTASFCFSFQDYISSKGLFEEDSIYEIISDIEAIDEQWTEELNRIKNKSFDINEIKEDTPLMAALNRIYQYIFFRSMGSCFDVETEELDQDCYRGIDHFAAYNTELIYLLYIANKDVTGGYSLSDAARRWSAQIEYASETVQALLKNVYMVKKK